MSDDHQSFVPIVPNPFITGTPVRDPELFFGREEDFAYARQRLETETAGIVLLLTGERRSGKTSILFQILRGRLGPDFLPVFVDMQAIAGVMDDRAFFAYVGERIGEQVPEKRSVTASDDGTQGNPALAFDRLLDDLRQVCPGRRLLVLVDEAELLREKVTRGELSGAVFLYFASILENRRVSFFLTGSPGLGEAPGASWRRLIGKATSRKLGFLSQADTLRLITQPVAGRVVYGEGVVEAIMRLTAGHPYYTQYLCSHIVAHLNSVQRQTVVLEDLEQIVRMILTNPPPNLVYNWEALSRLEQVTLSVLSDLCGDAQTGVRAEQLTEAMGDYGSLLTVPVEALSSQLDRLVEHEVLEQRDEGAYRIRVDLFRRWIRHARSIWRLVEERRVKRSPWPFVAGIGTAILAVGIAGLLWLRGPSEDTRRMADTPHVTTGHLWITSQPAHAEVWIDGTSRGRTDTQISYLDPGQHVVDVRLANYRPATDTVEVIAGQTDTCRIALVRSTGMLSVRSTPPGAHVVIRGTVDTSGVTPLLGLTLPTGNYTVEVEKGTYLTQRRSVMLLEDTSQDMPFTLTGIGTLVIASDPPGATIVLDGIRRRETTPATVESLAIGAHELRLELATYAAQRRTVAVELGRTQTVDVALTPLPAILDLRSHPPEAAIYLDDDTTAAGRTPALLQLTPGPHRIRVVLAGHGEEAFEITCSADEQLPMKTVQLTPQFGVIRVVRPRSAWVIIDHRDRKRVPPGDLVLPIGTHTLQIEATGVVKEVHVVKDSTVKVSFP